LLVGRLLHGEPTSFKEVIEEVRKQWCIVMPANEDELATLPRTSVDIRRDKVVENAIREARKAKFDSTKLLSVCLN